MRNLKALDQYRVHHPIGGWGNESSGAFTIPLEGTRLLFNVIASSGDGWEHVSVSAEERVPRWNEMHQIKELFFEDAEAVMQLHPPKRDHVNIHPNCLHLWRPKPGFGEIPLPPLHLV